jgi:hypothetical protein
VDDEKTVAKPMFSKVFVKSNGTLWWISLKAYSNNQLNLLF